MPTEQNHEQDANSQANAIWSTRYLSPEGFTCTLTLRGENGRDVLEKASTALGFLLQNGFVPERRPEGKLDRRHPAGSEKKICLIHLCSMQRFEKGGNVWFSHKLADGSWCRGRDQ